MQEKSVRGAAVLAAVVSIRNRKSAAIVGGNVTPLVERLESRQLMSSVLLPFIVDADPLAPVRADPVGPFATPPEAVEAPAPAPAAPKPAKPTVSLVASATSVAAPAVVTLS